MSPFQESSLFSAKNGPIAGTHRAFFRLSRFEAAEVLDLGLSAHARGRVGGSAEKGLRALSHFSAMDVYRSPALIYSVCDPEIGVENPSKYSTFHNLDINRPTKPLTIERYQCGVSLPLL